MSTFDIFLSCFMAVLAGFILVSLYKEHKEDKRIMALLPAFVHRHFYLAVVGASITIAACLMANSAHGRYKSASDVVFHGCLLFLISRLRSNGYRLTLAGWLIAFLAVTYLFVSLFRTIFG